MLKYTILMIKNLFVQQSLILQHYFYNLNQLLNKLKFYITGSFLLNYISIFVHSKNTWLKEALENRSYLTYNV
ncbi:hypothetical protein MTR_1g038540 [Medicago truncatula]|uniref:Uncharacterized protein n=1 Tax=Medicago truncatula TaxID=3880 RepID=G7IBE2_MEDTR|nr:hypothetical protein MTR_1g038540 [Medicago truncatula]